jgi:hypothetical protein
MTRNFRKCSSPTIARIGAPHRCRMTRAGLPTARTFGGRSRVTTAPAPTTVFSPMVTPGQTITPPPSQTLLPIVMGLALSHFACLERVGGGKELDIRTDLHVITDRDPGNVERHESPVGKGASADVRLVTIVAPDGRADDGAVSHTSEQLAKKAASRVVVAGGCVVLRGQGRGAITLSGQLGVVRDVVVTSQHPLAVGTAVRSEAWISHCISSHKLFPATV